jgi:hypothetical protein
VKAEEKRQKGRKERTVVEVRESQIVRVSGTCDQEGRQRVVVGFGGACQNETAVFPLARDKVLRSGL